MRWRNKPAVLTRQIFRGVWRTSRWKKSYRYIEHVPKIVSDTFLGIFFIKMVCWYYKDINIMFTEFTKN